MLRTAPSPFGAHSAPSQHTCPAPRPFVAAASSNSSCHGSISHSSMSRANSALTRQFSSTLQQQKTLQMPRQRSKCHAIPEMMLSSASAAVSSFDDVCEAFGDIAKLDNLVARGATSAAAVLAPVPGAPIGFDMSVGLSWGVEKIVASLGSLALLEGLVDKTLIDLFQQVFSALELAGSTFDTPWLRLGVAVATAVAVRQAVVGYKAAHPQKLKRQLSPAASLSDAIAEQAAAAVLNAAGLGPNLQQQQQQQMERQPTLAFAGAGAAVPVPSTNSSSSSSSSSSVGKALSDLVDSVKSGSTSVPKALGPAALAGSTMLVLGQVKRANKIKKQVSAIVKEVAGGTWSPAALMVVIEAAAFVHSYSEMAQGVGTLMNLGA